MFSTMIPVCEQIFRLYEIHPQACDQAIIQDKEEVLSECKSACIPTSLRPQQEPQTVTNKQETQFSERECVAIEIQYE